MKNIGLIDVGGTTIKFGLWDGQQDKLVKQDAVKTPTNLTAYYETLKEIVTKFKQDDHIVGVGISTPGAVNKLTGVIEGASALPYIHDFKIQTELEMLFELPVTMENDANCAALAELDRGVAKGMQNLLFMVIGTGIGGSVISDGKVQHGKHLFGGEFGFIYMPEGNTLSMLGTAVHMADRYNKTKGTDLSGKEVFARAHAGDLQAQKEADTMYRNLALAIYNLQYSFDPECIVLGGGVSQADFLIPNIQKELQKILDVVQIAPYMPNLLPCHFRNDANLIGAMVDFKQTYPNLLEIEDQL